MPIHDWSRIPSGIFHPFHQHWSIEITATLNRGSLPKGLSAMVEQRADPKEGDVLTVESRRLTRKSDPKERPRWQYLIARPHRWRRQLSIKGRNMTVGQLVSTIHANHYS